MIPHAAFALLADLEANNNKAWFDAHRDQIKEEVREPFLHLLEALSAQLADTAVPLRGGSKTMFRMHRDVRFAKDKSPYKPHVGGMLTPSGDKNEGAGMLYLHLEKSGGFAATGFYNLSPRELGPIRDGIVEEPGHLREIIADLDSAGLALSREFSLTAMPRGYAQHADAWFADYLKMKSFIVRIDMPIADWTSGAVLDRASKLALASAGLLRLNQPDTDTD